MSRRSYSYSPSPTRGYGRRRRSPSPRGRYSGRSRDLPTSLLVRNLRHDCSPEDLRGPFSQFGPLKDIYLPRDYYTGQPRGFGFIQFVEPADAAEAKYNMDGEVLLGRELTVVFAEENRKKPSEMRARDRGRQNTKWHMLYVCSGVVTASAGGHAHHGTDIVGIPGALNTIPVLLEEGDTLGHHLQGAGSIGPYLQGREATGRGPTRIRGLLTWTEAGAQVAAGAGASTSTCVSI
ncbi:unnamed protein product [Linum tenue]|uniref:RRM domain-containing protein n=1 Tax=Linum tenue TaxID=586396 RepID=A0AAV0IZA1_9ROSI|nr:unnamed protein product [Linum tenue]